MANNFYLRLDHNKKLITTLSSLDPAFYRIATKTPDQLYFMIGYPAAYLGLLYKKTCEAGTPRPEFLEAAKNYLDYALFSCDKSVYNSPTSHKIAWACSILLPLTHDKRYLEALKDITQYFQQNQATDGLWNGDPDQSAEIICWFSAIAANLEALEKEQTFIFSQEAQDDYSPSSGNSKKGNDPDQSYFTAARLTT